MPKDLPRNCLHDSARRVVDGGAMQIGTMALKSRQRKDMILARKVASQPRRQDIDQYVSTRIRERRILLGLTQQQMAELIGVTYQQARKYEKALNRVAAGRLYLIAQALGVEVGYFYEGLQTAAVALTSPEQRMLLQLARNFLDIRDRDHQAAVVYLARALAERENGDN
jgi:transcriptional regulator with XRE-family HTH domain